MLSLRFLLQFILIGIFQGGFSIYGPSASLAQYGDFPYMVKIMAFRNSQIKHCGGAIIDPTHILTAAHCVFGYLEKEILIIAGTVDLGSRFKIKQPGVAAIHIHKKYPFNEIQCTRWDQFRKWCRCNLRFCQNASNNRIPRHDIAVLTLTKALSGDYIKSVDLPDPNFSPVCHIGELAGWGKIEKNGSSSRRLYSTQMIILSRQECTELWTRLHSSEFCAIDPFHETCALKGDSGSPLVLDNIVYGVMVRGWDDPRRTTVFTKVAPYLKFIRRALRT